MATEKKRSSKKNYEGASPHFRVPTKDEAHGTRENIQNKDQVRKTIGRESYEKIGTYTMSTGGGTPLKKGEKAPSREWVAQNRVAQPRDKDGQFTYNSVNAIPLKEKSRGETIPPFLLGVKLNFAEKSNVTIEDGKFVNILTLNMDKDEFVRAFQIYDTGKGFKALASEISRKKGRRSKAEKEALSNKYDGAIGKNLTDVDHGEFELECISIYKANHGTPYLENIIGKAKESFKKTKTLNEGVESPNQPNPTQPPVNFTEPNNEQPKERVQEETQQTPKQPKNDPADVELAKNDQKAFVEKYSEQIDDLKEYAKQKGIGVVLDSIAEDFADGKTFEEMKQEVDKAAGIDITESEKVDQDYQPGQEKPEKPVREKSDIEKAKESAEKLREEMKKEPIDPDYVPGERPEKPELSTTKEKQVEQPKEEIPQPEQGVTSEQGSNQSVEEKETVKPQRKDTKQPTENKPKETVKSIAQEFGMDLEEVRKVVEDIKGRHGKVTASKLRERLTAIKKEKEERDSPDFNGEEQQAIKNDREAYKEKYANELRQISFDTGMKTHEILDAILNRQKLSFGIRANTIQDMLEYAKKYKEEKKKAEKAYGMNFR